MVVSALTLNRLHDERGDVVLAFVKETFGLIERCFLAVLGVGQRTRRRRKVDLWIVDPGPVELGEVLRLARIGGIGQRKRVAGATMECFAQMHDLRTAFGLVSATKILADLPVERRLECVLDAEGAAFDEEHMLVERRRNGQTGERLDELGHVRRINVGVRRLVDGDVGQFLAKLRRIEARMVVSDWAGREVREKIEDSSATFGVEQP